MQTVAVHRSYVRNVFSISLFLSFISVRTYLLYILFPSGSRVRLHAESRRVKDGRAGRPAAFACSDFVPFISLASLLLEHTVIFFVRLLVIFKHTDYRARSRRAREAASKYKRICAERDSLPLQHLVEKSFPITLNVKFQRLATRDGHSE